MVRIYARRRDSGTASIRLTMSTGVQRVTRESIRFCDRPTALFRCSRRRCPSAGAACSRSWIGKLMPTYKALEDTVKAHVPANDTTLFMALTNAQRINW